MAFRSLKRGDTIFSIAALGQTCCSVDINRYIVICMVVTDDNTSAAWCWISRPEFSPDNCCGSVSFIHAFFTTSHPWEKKK